MCDILTWLPNSLPRAGQAPGLGLRRWSPSCLLLRVKTKQIRCAYSWLWVCAAVGGVRGSTLSPAHFPVLPRGFAAPRLCGHI